MIAIRYQVTVAAVSLLCLSLPALAFRVQPPTAVNPAPACVPKEGVKVEGGVYSFTYDSWVREQADKSRFVFGRCITSEKPKKLWVDWKDTGVQGWTNDEGIIQNGVESPSAESNTLETELWYGASPKKTKSTYKDPKNNTIGKTGSIRSYAKMGLAPRPTTEAEEASTMPVQVDIEFEASVVRVPNGGTLYLVSWRNKLFNPRDNPPMILVKWPDKSYAKKMSYGPEPNQKHFAIERESKGLHRVEDVKGPLPIFRKVTVGFTTVDGQDLGSAPVGVYEPEKFQ